MAHELMYKYLLALSVLLRLKARNMPTQFKLTTHIPVLLLGLVLSTLPQCKANSEETPPAAKLTPPTNTTNDVTQNQKAAAQNAVPSAVQPNAMQPNEPTDFEKAFRFETHFDSSGPNLRVKLHVAPGFHVYTTGETIGKPLKLQLNESSAFQISGEVQYPAGITKDLPVGRSVIVEGEAEITAALAANAAAKTQQIQGDLRYQVCTDSACDRPRTAVLQVSVTAP